MAVSQRKGKKAKFSKTEGHIHTTRNGKKIKFLDPDQKARRFARELREGVNIYTGEKLTKTQKAWRSGRLAERKESAAAYRGSKKKKLYNTKKRLQAYTQKKR